MQETFLHFVWRTGRFDQRHLRTTAGQSISLFRRGIYHGHAGPDFSNAHLRIGETVWHGHVEMHLFASDWYRHQHQDDPLYDGTILHVVWEEDQPVFRRDGTRLPCLELRPLVHPQLLGQYQRLIADGNGIPCKFRLPEISDLVKRSMLDRTLIERLDRKADHLVHLLHQQGGDWEQITYMSLAEGLGTPVNKEPMEQIARAIPLRLLQRYRHDPHLVEALLLGQAGILPADPGPDPYARQLVSDYSFLARKHDLTPMPASRWKYLRMRPVNFPDLRLARLASLVVHHENWLANILYAANAREWVNSLEVGIPPYWTRHYRLGKPSPPSPKRLGKAMGHTLVINVMVPMLYAYGRSRGESKWQEKALDILASLPAESNAVTRTWTRYGLTPTQASDSQALLQLKQAYCAHKRCLHCALGCYLLQQKASPTRESRRTASPPVPG
ncbi:MAG: DUF2851 family protein [Saprospiraceae bacterium]